MPITNKLILGIESSCDESAIAIVENGRKIITSQIESQINLHEKYGGVVPEIASRYHVQAITALIETALTTSKINPASLSAIACTQGPGLIGTLLVGLNTAKALSYAWNKPLLGVNHLYAHICSCLLESNLEPPFLALLISGGHTELRLFESYTKSQLIGESLDDAIGEAFDKIARILSLKYPGGPELENLAKSGDLNYVKFPVAKVSNYDFSFSGLKTNIYRYCEKNPQYDAASVAACAQSALTQALLTKTLKAINDFKANKLVVCGGVSANNFIRQQFLSNIHIPINFPDLNFCTDNAAMIASAAYFNTKPIMYNATAFSRSKPLDS